MQKEQATDKPERKQSYKVTREDSASSNEENFITFDMDESVPFKLANMKVSCVQPTTTPVLKAQEV